MTAEEHRDKFKQNASKESYLDAAFFIIRYNQNRNEGCQPITMQEVFGEASTINVYNDAIERAKKLLSYAGYLGQAIHGYEGSPSAEFAFETVKKECLGFSDLTYNAVGSIGQLAMR